MAAFLEGEQLLAERRRLLAPEAQAAGVTSAASTQRALRAVLLLLRADYISPIAPTTFADAYLLFGGIVPALIFCPTDSSLLGSAMVYLLTAIHMPPSLLWWDEAQEAVALLVQADQGSSSVLREALARFTQPDGQLLLSLEQLQHITCFCAILGSFKARNDSGVRAALDAVPDRGAIVAQMLNVLAYCAETLVRLEPANPKSNYMAGIAAMTLVPATDSTEPLQSAADSFLLAHKQALQQRSAIIAADAAAMALMTCCVPQSMPLRRSTLAGAAAAFEQCEQLVLSCRKVLPAAWVQHAEGTLNKSRPLLDTVRALSQRTGPSGSTDAPLVPTENEVRLMRLARQQCGQTPPADTPLTCHGCGRTAVGLRRCAGCHRAKYCRWVEGCERVPMRGRP